MDISITDQDGNELEITLGSDIYLMEGASGSESNLAWSELSESTQQKLYELSEQCAEAVEEVISQAAKNLEDLMENEGLDDDETVEDEK